MRDYLPFLVVGVATGSIYALAATGLVVTYTTSGVFNFAHGAAGMVATYAFYSLRVDAELPTWLALAIAVLLVGPVLGFLVDVLLLRRLAGGPASTYVVTSIGLLVALQGGVMWIYGAEARPVAPFLPQSTFRFLDVNVGYDQAIIAVLAVAALVGLQVFFRRTDLGLRMRAVVDDDSLVALSGIEPRRIRSISWMLGFSFAALSGILISPFINLDALLLTLLVVQAFGAAVVGRLTSLPLTYAGAIGIAVAASVSTKFVGDFPSLSGVPNSLPFAVLFVVLLVSRRGSFRELTAERTLERAGQRRTFGVPQRVTVLVALGVAVVGAPFLPGARLVTATATVCFLLLYASLGLLIGVSRQVSLCQAMFIALGVTTTSHLLDAGLPFLPAVLLAGVVMVPVGAIIAVPAIRLSGLFLALATFGFGMLIQSLVLPSFLAFGKTSLVDLERPSFFGYELDTGLRYFYFVLAIVVVGVAAIELMARSRLGRILRASADTTAGVEAVGINPTAARVVVFCVSAYFAAVAGGLLGGLFGSVTTASYDFSRSLIWVAVLVAAGPATLTGWVVAAVATVAAPAFLTADWFTDAQPVLFGVGAMVLAQSRNGLVGALTPDFARLRGSSEWRLRRSPVTPLRPSKAAAP